MFWLAVVVTAVQLLLALTRSGALLTAVPSSQPGSLVCLSTPPALLHQVGSELTAPALAPGVHATWGTASLCTAHPTVGQALAFAVTLLPVALLILGALYLVMRLARTAARDGVYTPQAARLVLILGWWLLAGGLAATAAQAFARVNLLSELVTGPRRLGSVARRLVGVLARLLVRPRPDHLRPHHAGQRRDARRSRGDGVVAPAAPEAHAIVIHLDKLLADRGMTLTELSEQVGVSIVNLSILKNGHARAIRFSTLTRLCQALDCQPGDLLTHDGTDNETG